MILVECGLLKVLKVTVRFATSDAIYLKKMAAAMPPAVVFVLPMKALMKSLARSTKNQYKFALQLQNCIDFFWKIVYTIIRRDENECIYIKKYRKTIN